MPTEFTFDDMPAGVSLSGALNNEDLLVSTKAYLSSEDGNDFISHVEAVWGHFSAAFRPRGILPSQVDHLLAVIDRNKKASIYLNELETRGLVRAKRPIEAGQQVLRDDIAGVEELVFHDSSGTPVTIPPDNAVVLIFSVGWRKCLYYDFSTLFPETPTRSLNMARLFGRFHQQLLFQDMYSITDKQWAGMIQWGWFPFIWMTQEDRNKILYFSARSDEPKSLFEDVCDNYKEVLKERSESWQDLAFFQDHADFINKAVEHHLNGDFLSAIQVLYPRIEGIMRQLHLLNMPGKPTQRTMAEVVVKDHEDYSLLLPSRFREYLIEFYFRAFNETTGDLPLSRNSVAHGTSLPADYEVVKSSLGFMICDQMFYFLGPTRESKS